MSGGRGPPWSGPGRWAVLSATVSAAPLPPDGPGDLPPRVTVAIAASIATIAGEPVDEAQPPARRAATVIRAIQAHEVDRTRRAPTGEG